MLKFLFFLVIFYFFFKLVKRFFTPKTTKAQSEPKVRKTKEKQETIRQEDIIEASFEEIKTEEKDKN
ncbi:MAG: hypothetical protein ACEPO8_02545 [Rhodothermaceae bacterium]